MTGELCQPAVLPVDTAAPQIAQLNVSHNSRLHVGPQFVSVTQNVHHDKVVKGRVLGLRVAAGGAGARCAVAVCVCWALAAATVLAALAVCLALPRSAHIDLPLNATWYLRRADWQAMLAHGSTRLQIPARFALFGHSATAVCTDRYECMESALEMQHEHQRWGWYDIGPNFLVGGGNEGVVMEGRGAGLLGSMLRGWNAKCVSIMFVGDFRRGKDEPSPAALTHLRALLATLVAVGALHPEYVLLGACQLNYWTYSPGARLMQELSHFEHWDARNVTACLEWRKFGDTITIPAPT